jgi:lipooligosaccharide transport system permease protein
MNAWAVPEVTRRAVRVWQRNLDSFRKYLVGSLAGSLGEPVLYLVAMGYGLGNFVGAIGGRSYAEYIAPGLVVSAAMWAATFEGTYGTYLRMVHQKTYDAILATPLSLDDVVAGDALWAATKGMANGIIMLAVVVGFGLVRSPWAVLLLPLTALASLLFACLAVLVAAVSRNWEFFNYYITLVISPLFFFSGIFFPLTNFPAWVRDIGTLSPLTHAVALAHAMARGTPPEHPILGLTFLLVPAAASFYLALALIRRRLIK